MTEYKPVFIPVVIDTTKKVDFNYYGIRQKLRKIGIDTFRKVKTEEIKKEPFDYKQYYEDMNQCILDFYNKINEVLNYDRKKES